MDLTVKYYLDDFVRENDINTLVLGCTHYPLIAGNIRRIYPDIKIISSSKEVATAVQMELESMEMLAEEGAGEGVENVFYASDLSESFVNMIERILKADAADLDIHFKNLDI